MGHRIPNHTSKCKNLHGHRYKAEVTLRGAIQTKKNSSEEDMVLDFGDIKQILHEEIVDKHDHAFMISQKDKILLRFAEENTDLKFVIVSFIPTAERIVEKLAKAIEVRLIAQYGDNLQLESVKLWETPTSAAIYKSSRE